MERSKLYKKLEQTEDSICKIITIARFLEEKISRMPCECLKIEDFAQAIYARKCDICTLRDLMRDLIE